MTAMSSFYLKTQVTRYVVLFVERSGSTYLATLLDSHPDIKALREQFAVLIQQGKGAEDQLNWARNFYTHPLLGRYKSYGFKTKLVDILDRQGFARLLEEKNCRVITLYRRNSVKAVISTINAKRLYEASGNWNLLDEKNRQSSFEIDPTEFGELLEERQTWDQELEAYSSQLNTPKIKLFYEDLLQNEQELLDKVFAHIKVKPRPVQGKTLKHTKDNLREVITNFDQLRYRYVGTVYEQMFDEVLV